MLLKAMWSILILYDTFKEEILKPLSNTYLRFLSLINIIVLIKRKSAAFFFVFILIQTRVQNKLKVLVYQNSALNTKF